MFIGTDYFFNQKDTHFEKYGLITDYGKIEVNL